MAGQIGGAVHFVYLCWTALVALFWPIAAGVGIGLVAAAYVKATSEPFTRARTTETEDYRRHFDEAMQLANLPRTSPAARSYVRSTGQGARVPQQRAAGELS